VASTTQHLPINPAFTIPESVPCELFWYAVQTRPRHEKKVAFELQNQKEITAFLPLCSSTRQWSDRRVVLDMPLFPGYVFVRITRDLHMRVAVLRTLGVAGFVGPRGIGAPIPDAQIDSVQAVLTRGIPFSPFPFLDIGQRVRIRDGSLQGVEGILTAVNGDNSLVISVELIQRSLAIRITGYTVEPA
jgi:transcription termination/antitermination protein NusG